MANPKPDKNLLFNVITRTIEIDNIIEVIIREHFSCSARYEKGGKILNLKQVEDFEKYIWRNMGASTKLKILESIWPDIDEYEKLREALTSIKRFLIRFYDIRNVFAHSLSPQKLYKKADPRFQRVNWKDLHDEHEEIYNEISISLIADFF